MKLDEAKTAVVTRQECGDPGVTLLGIRLARQPRITQSTSEANLLTEHPDAVRLRLLCFADLEPNLGMSVPDFVRRHRIDALITAGDLLTSAITGFGAIPVPAAGVYGNHCNGTYLEKYGLFNLHRQAAQLSGVRFVGLEGCVRYKPEGTRDILYTQEQYRDMIATLPAADVLVTHCPPSGINDDPRDPAHLGIDALREWVDANQPALIIHGHTYPTELVTQYGPTRIEYVHGAAILDIVFTPRTPAPDVVRSLQIMLPNAAGSAKKEG